LDYEIVKQKRNGILVRRSKNHVHSFSEGLKTLISDPELRKKLGDNAKQDIAKYQPELIVDRWENIIRDVHDKK